jgi:phthalate 4,5-dioxygenase
MGIEQDREDLTRVGPGTVMGEFMRQYWVPAAMSSELKADGDPMRLMLLGEKLIAFRDSQGRVGVMDHRCPHRCASLFLGRNEQGGLRCVYHGWKFDAEGNCVDMPNAPPALDFKHKVHAKAYKTAERNGLIWVYMGAREKAPPLPAIEPSLLPPDDMICQFVQRKCNWLQALEGDIDTSHFGFLHMGQMALEDFEPDDMTRYTILNRAPDYHVSDAPWGTTYAAFRAAEPGRTYWRFANYMLPFWTQTPQGEFPTHIGARAWVPMDDEHTMFVHLHWKSAPVSYRMNKPDGKRLLHINRVHNYQPNTTDWYGRWRLVGNESNDWLIDRESQRNNINFTGMDNIHLQDQAVTESMGPITDHAHEHLGPSDRMIARTRRRALLAARAFREQGTVPPGVDDPGVYMQSRSGYFIVGDGADWRDAYKQQVATAQRPAPMQQAAE